MKKVLSVAAIMLALSTATFAQEKSEKKQSHTKK